MKRFVLMAVAMVFVLALALPAFAQDSKEKPIAPKKQLKVRTDREQTAPSDQEDPNWVQRPVQKKGLKPKKQSKAKTELEQATPSDQEDPEWVDRPVKKKGLKPKKQRKAATETEIERKGKPEKPDNP